MAASTGEVKSSVPRDVIKCASCDAAVEPEVVAFCRSNEKRFGGKILCGTCQTAATAKAVAPTPSVTASRASCHQCHEPVDTKVVAFCRFNSRRFGRQILCRSCQSSSVGGELNTSPSHCPILNRTAECGGNGQKNSGQGLGEGNELTGEGTSKTSPNVGARQKHVLRNVLSLVQNLL